MRILLLLFTLVLAAPAFAGDLKLIRVQAIEGNENFSMDIRIGSSDDAYEYEDYNYGKHSGSTYDSVELYQYISVQPQTKFSISTKRNGLMLMGDFKPGTQYKITLKKGLKSKEGELLPEEHVQEVATGNFSPHFTFKSKARYLAGHLQGQLAWEAVNMKDVELEIRQVYNQNLHQWLTTGEQASDFVSDVLGTKRLVTKGKNNRIVKGNFSLAEFEALGQGIFVIQARAVPVKKKKKKKHGRHGAVVEEADDVPAPPPVEEGGEEAPVDYSAPNPGARYDSATVVVTNLTVVAKRGANSAKVWVVNTKDLKPVSGANVDLVATSNRGLDKCTTSGSDAECTLKWKAGTNAEPYALVVRSGKDATYVRFNDLTLPNDTIQAGHRAYSGASGGFDAYVYSERDLYRPGETVGVAAQVRNLKFEAVPKLPVLWRVTSPRGKVVNESVSDTSDLGVATMRFPTTPASDTGKYVVTASTGNNVLHETSVLVEEFVPERIGLKVTSPQEVWVAKKQIPFAIAANYLFGPPVKNGAYKISCTMKSAFKTIPNHTAYSTGIYSREEKQTVSLDANEGSLDANGKAQSACTIASSDNGPMAEAFELNARVEVAEAASGRATLKSGSAYVATTDHLVGLKLDNNKDQRFQVSGGFFDFKGNVLKQTGKVKLSLFTIRQHWYYTYGNYDSWKAEEMITPTSVEKVVDVVDGKFSATLIPPGDEWGSWLVRAVDVKTGYTADLNAGYLGWYWGMSSEGGGGKPPEPSALKVVTSKSEVSPGDKIEASIEAPFAGRLLVAFETDKVIESKWVKVDKPGIVKIDWKVPDTLPNVYLTALLLKNPVEAGGKRFIPARAWGAASLQVIPSAHRLAVKISHSEISESNKKVSIQLSNDANVATEYSLAVVDEGILQMTNFKSPDPMKRFFEARSLGVGSAETLGWTIPVENVGGKNPGGDKAGATQSKTMPVRLVSYWFPSVKSDSSGKAAINLDLPSFQGKLRVMAVASGKTRLGGQSDFMTVRDPLVLQPTLPRFLTQGDKFQFPVNITNMTGKEQTVTVNVSADGMVKIATTKQMFKVANNQSKVFLFDTEVKGASGTTKIAISATSEDGKFKSNENFELPVKPAGEEQTLRFSFEPGKEVDLTKSIPSDWNQSYLRVEAMVAPMPYLNQISRLDFLIHYPYGCIEQTTSGTMPLLAVGDLMEWISPKSAKKGKIKDMVNYGINRVLSMQTASGGFSYWPGSATADPWGTSYATHMLLDAKKLGYDVPPTALKNAISYLETYVRNSRFKLAGVHQGYHSEAETVPMALYVLAKAGSSMTQELRETVRDYKFTAQKSWYGLAGEDYFLLSAAAHLLGDKETEKKLNDESAYSAVFVGQREDSWTYWSAMRSDGMRLSILEDIMPKSPAVETLAARVAASLGQDRYWYSTQDIAWGVLGLGKRLKGLSTNVKGKLGDVTLQVDGKKIAKSFDVNGAPGFQMEGTLHKSKFKVNGAPNEKGVYLYLKATGYAKEPKAPGKYGLYITRKFRNREGKEINVADLKQGDTVYVELDVSSTRDYETKNIAIVDRLPAGFEIENPRLGKSQDLDWMTEPFKPDYQDMRDDRIQVFGKLRSQEHATIYYSARAVTKGTFTAPSSYIEAMYDPENFYYDSPAQVKIGDSQKSK